jgi:hypothetical protein
MNQRGQTLYDFLLGVSILLVSIILVLSLFDPLFAPFTDPVSGADDEQVDRLADEIVETNATVFGDQTLNLTDDSFDDDFIDEMKNRSGVSEFRDVNVTLRDDTGDFIEVGGDPVLGGDIRPENEPASSATRAVRLEPGRAVCQTGCILRVEVW